MTEQIRIIGSASSKWTPVQDGFFFTRHIEENLTKLTEQDRKNYTEDTVEILSRSINPSELKDGNGLSSTGIVIGYIQSGKTASMEGLISLAKDNGFQIIILLSGVVSNLTDQTKERVFDSISGSGWNQIYAKNLNDFDINGLTSDIIRCLKGFQNSPEDTRNETSLIIQMKNKTRINKLTDLFDNLKSQYDLSKVPCLIIDDEGDQHSLSAVNPRIENQTLHVVKKGETIDTICNKYIISEDELIYLNSDKKSDGNDNLIIKPGDELLVERAESPIHRALRELRKSIPNHSFLSYTATPQASLIIPVIDFLSPNFAIILRPGEDYTGVNYFFDQEAISNHTQVIPKEELLLYSQEQIVPETLQTALIEFIIGVSIGYYFNEDKVGGKNRTMMITPSQKVSEHYRYLNQVREIIENWIEEFEFNNKDSESLFGRFYEVYLENIMPNYPKNIPEFDNLKKLIITALRTTKLKEINARDQTRIPSINWKSDYSLILVGGIGLERGYTVEGLTVTYMSRASSKQQDTVQQRARFAGYRKKYKDLIKIYLTDDLKDFYMKYTDAENFLNDSIKKYQNENHQSLNNWKRVFMSRRGTSLTRRGMTDRNLVRFGVRQVKQALSHDLKLEQQEENLKIYNYIKKLPMQELQEVSKRPEADRRNSCLITKGYTLEMSQDEILSKIQSHYDESGFFVDANSLISNYLNKKNNEEKKLELKIILMNFDTNESTRIIKEQNSDSRKLNIHIGRSQAQGFCGDDRIHYDYLINNTNGIEAVETPTLQVYKFTNVKHETDANFLQNEVVYFCLKLPKDIHQNSSLIRME